jgi:tetrahydromethanopterin S-methyltransferase subunit H
LSTQVERNLPKPDRIREVLAARFLRDPAFRVNVNGRSVPLEEYAGLSDRAMLNISERARVEVFLVDSTKVAPGASPSWKRWASWQATGKWTSCTPFVGS